MKSKQAQVTLFIIVGLVLLITIILASYLGRNKVTVNEQLGAEGSLQSAELSLDNCFDVTCTNTVTLFGLQGGYVQLPGKTIEVENQTVGIQYLNHTGKIDRDTMQVDLTEGMKRRFTQCLKTATEHFDSEPSGDYAVQVKIEGNDVVCSLNGSLQVSDSGSTRMISGRQKIIQMRLGRMLDFAQEVIDNIGFAPVLLPWPELTQNFTLDYQKVGQDILFVIGDQLADKKGAPAVLLLAVRPDSVPQDGPILSSVPDLNLTVGQQFTYQLNATSPANREIFYLSDSAILPVNPSTGTINFTPSATMAGTHWVRLEAIDSEGLDDSTTAKVTVVWKGDWPKLYLENQTIAIGENLSYQPDVIDFSGETLSFTLHSSPSDADINATNGFIAWKPSGAGNFTFKVKVTGTSRSDSGTFNVEVKE